MTVEIDRNSGFCGGVIRAIDGAERVLAEKGSLYSLGAIVHNEAELARLQRLGLRTIDSVDGPPAARKRAACLSGDSTGSRPVLLIRAHGEPPQTYRIAREKGYEVVDFTCPVVLKIQKSIREAWQRSRPDGQIVLFGKVGHAEVLGLVGQVDGKAKVVEDIAQLEEAISDGSIDVGKPIDIFSQTTKSPEGYAALCSALAERMASENLLTVHNTICTQVASRYKQLSDFADGHDVVVFVSGKESSNGRVLCDLCRSVNGRTYQVGEASGIRAEWFLPDDNVGVCGATSTPKWLLEEVATQIKNLH